jgi:hypothetical protein
VDVKAGAQQLQLQSQHQHACLLCQQAILLRSCLRLQLHSRLRLQHSMQRSVGRQWLRQPRRKEEVVEEPGQLSL